MILCLSLDSKIFHVKCLGQVPHPATNTWTTQIGRSCCLFGKRRLFAVGGVFSFPGSVFFKIKLCAKQAAGNRRNSAGNRRNFAEAGFSMSECLLRFGVVYRRRFFLAFRRKFLPPGPFGRKFCRRRVQVLLDKIHEEYYATGRNTQAPSPLLVTCPNGF